MLAVNVPVLVLVFSVLLMCAVTGVLEILAFKEWFIFPDNKVFDMFAIFEPPTMYPVLIILLKCTRALNPESRGLRLNILSLAVAIIEPHPTH
jgi:hypothetical protein